jgi:O-antigen/teichoic acid export membrane protein
MLRATVTLLTGGALAQLVPLLLWPVIARLYSPEALGAFTAFSTVAATVAVVACARYEYALPLARSDTEAATLLALCLRVWVLVTMLSVSLAALLHALGLLPIAWMLPLTVAATGLLQLLVMWANRAERYRALAASRLIQYGGAALLQLALGWWLWSGQTAGADAAWTLVVATVLAALLALLVVARPAPAGGWRAVLGRRTASSGSESVAAVARKYRDFPLLNTPHAFLGTLQDALAVGLLMAWSGEAAAGYWGLALRYLKAPATLIGTAVSQSLYPRLTQATPAEGQRAVRQVLGVLLALGLALGLGLALLGPRLFEVVFGPAWRPAGELARALSPYIALHFVASPLAVVTMAWQGQPWALRLAVVGQVAFLLALGWGLWTGGLLRGAWAVSGVMTVYFGYYFWRLAHWPMIPAQASPAAPRTVA